MADLPPGVTSYEDRHGKTRYRFRRKGLPTYPLPAPDDAAFAAAYAAACAGMARPAARRRRKAATPAPRTLRAAWIEVGRTIEWTQLRPSSRAQQAGVAERFLETRIAPDSRTTFGQMPIAGLRRGDVKKVLGRYADHPHAGEAVLRLMRKLCGVALDMEWIDSDPTYRVTFRPALIGHRAWNDDELARYEAKWPLGTRERLAYALALYTGQRRADVAAMAAGAYSGGGIAVVQDKTGVPLWIPVHPELRAALAAGPRGDGWLLTTSRGGRYAKESFGNFMADAIARAGLPDECRLHGLRKAAGRSLAEAGCTAHQIMAILGHKSLAEAQRYTREADQKRMAQQAMDKWSGPKLVALPGGK